MKTLKILLGSVALSALFAGSAFAYSCDCDKKEDEKKDAVIFNCNKQDDEKKDAITFDISSGCDKKEDEKKDA